MKTKICRITKVICFCLIAVLMVSYLTDLLKPKWLENRWQSAKTNNSFYDLEKNTTDVLFFGSSVTAASIDPYQLYNDYGISGYNLGVMSQPMVGTFFWFKEALKTQSPKVVVIDIKALGRVSAKDEEKGRKSYDYMKEGKNKLQYALEYKNSSKILDGTDDEVNLMEYLFPLELYHSRWSELSYDDFDFIKGNDKSYTRGFAALYDIFKYRASYSATKAEKGLYDGFDENPDATGTYNSTNKDYLKRLVDIANQKNIKLLFYRAPDSTWSVKQYNYVKEYAQKLNIPYIDFNLKSIRKELDFDYETEAADTFHVNIEGAKKVTAYIGKYLHDNYGLENHKNNKNDKVNEIFSKEMENYNLTMKDTKLCMIMDADKYLDYINNDNYVVSIIGTPSVKINFTSNQLSKLEKLGVDTSIFKNTQYGSNIISVHDKKLSVDTEKIQDKSRTIVTTEGGNFDDGTSFSITTQNGNCSMRIDNNAYKYLNTSGFNIVVYNKKLKSVADAIYLYMDNDTVKIGRESRE